MEWLLKTADWFKTIISQNFAAVTGLLGVYVGTWLTNRQNRSQRRSDFYEKQLREFYSPLVGIRKEVKILGDIRLEGEKAQQKWWQDVSKRGNSIKDLSESQKFYDKKGEKLTSQLEYENRQLTEKIIPTYRQMVKIFKDNYWLAEEQTKKYFPTLVKFIEVWDGHLSRTHAREVLAELNVSEEKLLPFYSHLEEVHNSLREKLRGGKI